MNLPNKLTIFRVFLILPFVLLLLGESGGWVFQLNLISVRLENSRIGRVTRL